MMMFFYLFYKVVFYFINYVLATTRRSRQNSNLGFIITGEIVIEEKITRKIRVRIF
jgi:hypothetical protein